MSSLRRAFSDAFVFGRSANSKAHCKTEKRLAECLPAADWPVYDEEGNLKAFNGWHVFGSETARGHFIKHALILLSENGKHDLCNLDFDNFFARSYTKDGVIWYTASIVVTAPGDYRIRHSIVATRAGTTKTAAFQLLMLDVETKLDAVLRGSGVNGGSLPAAKAAKRKASRGMVSIIATPSQAMAPPRLRTDDYPTWSGAPLTRSPKSKQSPPLSNHSSQSSNRTQRSIASSQRSDSTQATAPSVHKVPAAQPKISHQPSLASVAAIANTSKHAQHSRHASTPLQSTKAPHSPNLSRLKHASHQLLPRSATAPPQTTLKLLPPLPDSSVKDKAELSASASTERLPLKSPTSPQEKIHPALRSKSHSAEGLKPTPVSASPISKEPSLSGSSVYSRPSEKPTESAECSPVTTTNTRSPDVRSPVSPVNEDTAKEVQCQPLHVSPDTDVPSPCHFDKPIAQFPARLLRQQMAFEIYV